MERKHVVMFLFAWTGMAFACGFWKMLIATVLFFAVGLLMTLRAKSDGPAY